jgi:hypothetical protein
MEVETHSEHQENHADLRKLRRDLLVRYVAWGEWSNQNPRQQVAHDRRKFQFLCGETQAQGSRQPAGQGQNQINVVRHRCSLPFIENGRQRILPNARSSEVFRNS